VTYGPGISALRLRVGALVLGPVVADDGASRLIELTESVAVAADLAAPVTVNVTGMLVGEPATAWAHPAEVAGL
jgi:phosphate/sulfate permease